MGMPCVVPSSDMVTALLRKNIVPPTMAPGRSMLSPDVDTDTLHSSGWMSGQW